jgi:hypothetical protein
MESLHALTAQSEPAVSVQIHHVTSFVVSIGNESGHAAAPPFVIRRFEMRDNAESGRSLLRRKRGRCYATAMHVPADAKPSFESRSHAAGATIIE